MVPAPPSPSRMTMLDTSWGRSLGMRFRMSPMLAFHSLSTATGDVCSSTMIPVIIFNNLWFWIKKNSGVIWTLMSVCIYISDQNHIVLRWQKVKCSCTSLFLIWWWGRPVVYAPLLCTQNNVQRRDFWSGLDISSAVPWINTSTTHN